MTPLSERIRNEWAKIRGLKGKDLWEYIWEYYKLQIIFLAVCVFALGSFVNRVFINPPRTPVITIAWNHSHQETEHLNSISEQLTAALTEHPDREFAEILPFVFVGIPQLDFTTQNRFIALVMTAQLDLIIGTRREITSLMYDQELRLFADLRPFLPETDSSAGQWGMLYYRSPAGAEFPYAVSLAGSYLLRRGQPMEELPFLAVFANTRRDDDIIREAVKLLLTGVIHD